MVCGADLGAILLLISLPDWTDAALALMLAVESCSEIGVVVVVIGP